MIIVIVAIFVVVSIGGVIANGFGHDSPTVSAPEPPSTPQGGLVESLLAPLKWVYDNSVGALVEIIGGVPNGMPTEIIIFLTTLLTIIIVLYLIELIRGKG